MDDLNLKRELSHEIDERLEELGALNLTSEEYKTATEGIAKIADRVIEMEKVELEREFKAQQLKDEKRDKIIKTGIEVGKFVVGGALWTWAFVASMNFEKEGTLTTQGGRNAINQLLKIVKF